MILLVGEQKGLQMPLLLGINTHLIPLNMSLKFRPRVAPLMNQDIWKPSNFHASTMKESGLKSKTEKFSKDLRKVDLLLFKAS